MEYAARVCEDGRIQSVTQHSNGVTNIAKTDAKYMFIRCIIAIICKLHDMGKNTAKSNEYQHTVGKGDKWDFGKIPHSNAGGRYIYETFVINNSHKSANDVYLAEIICIAIMSHHGLFDCIEAESASDNTENNKFINKINNENYDYFEAKSITLEQIITESEIKELFKVAKVELSEIIKKININKTKNEFTFELALLERIITSILINADHTDAAEFCNQIKIDTIYGSKEMWQECSNYIENKISKFNSDSEINKIRGEISKQALQFSKNDVAIVRMNIPTGGGKTLSSLRYAVNHSKKFSKNRIIYVAPYNSILEQNFDVIKSFLPDYINVLPHFGDTITYENTKSNYKYFTENWGAPVIATSMVQFLNTLFDGKITSIRRMRALENSVIIIDEVQSLPICCTSIFNIAIEFLTKACGCTVVLCTATQPTLDCVKHKLFFSENCEMIKNYQDYYVKLKRTQIVDKLTDSGYSFDDTAEFVIDISLKTKNVLCIVNTKKSANKIYYLIKEKLKSLQKDTEYNIIHLSTNMCPVHRRKVINDMRHKMKENKKVICISTQLIEAGVDISFNTVVRSLSGIDNIIQAAGRCNRNGESDLGYVYMLNIYEENISMLKEIKIGAAITKSMIMNMRSNKNLFNGDISSKSAIDHYYKLFYEEFAKELDFNVKVNYISRTLFDLLSVNQRGVEHYKMYHHNSFPPNRMWQAFKTAGEKFEAISDNGMNVVVPFEKGKQLIEQICSGIKQQDIKAILTEIQQYSISLSKAYEKNEYIYMDEQTGIYILKEGFYDEESGFVTEHILDTMIF